MGLVVGWSPLLVSPASGQVPPGQRDLRYRLASDPSPVPSFKCSSCLPHTVGEGDSLRTGHPPTHTQRPLLWHVFQQYMDPRLGSSSFGLTIVSGSASVNQSDSTLLSFRPPQGSLPHNVHFTVMEQDVGSLQPP